MCVGLKAERLRRRLDEGFGMVEGDEDVVLELLEAERREGGS